MNPTAAAVNPAAAAVNPAAAAVNPTAAAVNPAAAILFADILSIKPFNDIKYSLSCSAYLFVIM